MFNCSYNYKMGKTHKKEFNHVEVNSQAWISFLPALSNVTVSAAKSYCYLHQY